MDKRLIFIFISVIVLGLLHGYLTTKQKHVKVLNDAYYLVDKNNRLMKKEVDKIIEQNGYESAYAYVDEMEDKYIKIYGSE